MSSNKVLVIGGGPAGLEAARSAAELGGEVILLEKRERLGGTPDRENYAKLTHHWRDASEAMAELSNAVTSNANVEVKYSTEVKGMSGGVGNFNVEVEAGGSAESLNVGSIIIATGFQHFDPGRATQYYNYYSFPDVITLTDLEKMLKEHKVVRPSNGEVPKKVAFIQCVGSRDRQIGNEYCSKVCCGIASKQAIEIREQLPDSKVMIFYIDMRMYGYWENEIYWPAQEKYKVNYVKGVISEVLKKGDKLLIRGEDTTMSRPMEVTMDMVVLSVGMEPSAGTRSIAQLLGVKQNKYGFIEAGGEGGLDTVATSVPGIFVAGAAAGPSDLDDSISEAGLAAARRRLQSQSNGGCIVMALPQRQSHIIKQKTGPDDPELQANLQEALGQVAPEDVIAIADELAERHARLFRRLETDSASLSSSFADIASAVAHTKANARTIVNYFAQGDYSLFEKLLHDEAPASVRVAAFVEKVNALDTRLALELATGLLHNISPKEHWLWTRWLWDPTVGTGILPLLAGSTHNLQAENLADGYVRVGSVSAMSVKFGEGTGLFVDELTSDEKRAPFANSAFLACAYSVYLYGTTSWRLSREFNGLLPTLPNMARRLLGLKKAGK